MSTGRSWTLTIPAPTVMLSSHKDPRTGQKVYRPAAGWLSLNDRYHPQVRARLVRDWQDATKQLARKARMRPGMFTCRVRFDALLQFTGATRRDTGNWDKTAKAVVDALTRGTKTHPGLGLLVDDEPVKYLHCEDCPHLRKDPVLLPRRPFQPLGVLILTVTEVPEEIAL